MGHLDSEILVRSVGFTVVIDVSDHGCCDRDTENIVSVGEEPDSSDQACSSVEPLLVSDDTTTGDEAIKTDTDGRG